MAMRGAAPLLALLATVAGAMTACSRGADVVFVGGHVWTGDSLSGETIPTAVAVKDGVIAAVGSDEEILALAGSDTRRIDLARRLVVPGLIDSHTHFISGGFELSGVQLRDAATPVEFSRRIGAFAAAHPGGWVTGGTWDHELWGGELPRRDWIDSLTADSPVFVSRLDGHMALANSRALELYLSTGFEPRTTEDYWKVAVLKIRRHRLEFLSPAHGGQCAQGRSPHRRRGL